MRRAAAIALGLAGCSEVPTPPAGGADPTFARDIAPIVFAHCTPCHRPGQVTPFPFLTYEDVRKRSRQIAEVTASGYMPPWLPVEGFGHFVGERRLGAGQIALLSRWADAGAPEGDPADLPPTPTFPDGWILGEPDLVVTPPEPFPLPASGRDIYQNIVIPDVTATPHFVRAIAFDPGDTRSIHHAFVLVDPSDQSAALDAATPEPGFPGMEVGPGAQAPDGHFIGWQPGKTPHTAPEGMAWRLPAGADVVLQLHMRTTGKPESVQPQVAFYFTAAAPTRAATKLVLATREIDIPAGATGHAVGATYRVPVDINVLGVVPHAHYLGDDLHVFATLPDGTKRWIIRIDDWDFDWQGDYQFASPLPIPAGSVITQRFTFDNSATNPANPNSPPKRVTYGLNSTDEMAEAWLQVIPTRPADLPALQRDFTRHMLARHRTDLERKLAAGTLDVRGYLDLARILLPDRPPAEVSRLIATAAKLDPDSPEPPYLMGMVYVRAGQLPNARPHFERALSADPRHLGANNAMGNLSLGDGSPALALEYYRTAAAAHPEDATSQANTGLALLKLGLPDEAVSPLQKALEISPGHQAAAANLRRALADAGHR
ncbi:hypothetical protein BH23VER1_BH23VER1_25220 [soil metagenome]